MEGRVLALELGNWAADISHSVTNLPFSDGKIVRRTLEYTYKPPFYDLWPCPIRSVLLRQSILPCDEIPQYTNDQDHKHHSP